jgi:Xaa-Pro aminopeptidase
LEEIVGRASDQRTRRRLAALRAEFANWKVDFILIGGASNRRWLSGFTGSTGWLLVGERTAVLGADFRYWDQAVRQAPEFTLRDFRSGTPAAWKKFLAFDRPVRLGIEAHHLTLTQFNEFRDVENVAFVELESSLENFRLVKSDEEIATIRQAAAITDAVMAGVNQMAHLGQQEKELAWKLESQMRERGATAMAFPPIVAFGRNAAMAHHQPGERALRAGDPVIVDMGAQLNGYASDLTRSFYAGPEPSAKYREVYDLVERAQKAALDGMRAGVSGKEADTLARSTIAGAGYGEAFGHSLGHGLGLDVHEGPSLSQLHGAAPLPEDSIVTVEPGIYLPDWGGVRIEDLVRVTERGVELISHCPRSPAIDI